MFEAFYKKSTIKKQQKSMSKASAKTGHKALVGRKKQQPKYVIFTEKRTNAFGEQKINQSETMLY